jgi:hypothetical protein
MVHNASGGEMLLPGPVPGYVEQHSASVDYGLRRDVPESGRMMLSPGEAAAWQYTAEREAERVLIKDIAKHTTFRAGQGGYTHYAGWREINGHPLILLKANDADSSLLSCYHCRVILTA